MNLLIVLTISIASRNDEVLLQQATTLWKKQKDTKECRTKVHT